MLLSYVFRFDLYRLADTERLEAGACGSPYWWLLHWSSGAGPKGGALLPGVLYSLEGGTPLETIGGMTRLPPCLWTAASPPGLSLLAEAFRFLKLLHVSKILLLKCLEKKFSAN